MNPLVSADTTLAALWAGTEADPQDRLAKLVFADALEESSEPILNRWAALVRILVEIEEIGPERLQIDNATIHKRGGPGYYQLLVDNDLELKIGERVDVHPYTTRRDFQVKGPRKTIHGLRILRQEPDDEFCTILTLVKDSYSKPYPRERLSELGIAYSKGIDLLVAEVPGTVRADWLLPTASYVVGFW